MSASSPVANADTSLDHLDDLTTSRRRKSGRVRSKPAKYLDDTPPAQIQNNGVKRKRVQSRISHAVTDGADDEPDENIGEEGMDGREESSEADDGDEEPGAGNKRKGRAAGKRSAKKPKTSTLAMRPAINGVRPKGSKPKARASGASQGAESGLYAEIFVQDRPLDAIAADWIKSWDNYNSQAMTDLINLVIRCTGCTLTVDVHDIEDPDNAVNKLTDIQDGFIAQKPSEYPLTSRQKTYIGFRATMTGFFETLIQTCHMSGLLYSDLAIIENLSVWVSTMSSSGMRPFRHTATVIALAIANQLCRVAAELSADAARTTRQKEGEQKKKSSNNQRIKTFDTKIAELDRKREQAIASLNELFDTVFVHRYRDVDPKIRAECVSALGTWITTLPDVFFEGLYLRYLGWVLSDAAASTRSEVIKQLIRLFKDKENVSRLRTFTDRFRSRLVEMAMQDAEVNIRASTIDLLDLIRETGLLEPSDIDHIGSLVFDAEPKVRKAVAGFFAENVTDMYDNLVDEMGGEENLTETLGEDSELDEDAPRKAWLKLKSVVEALQSYDAEGDEADGAPTDLRSLLLAGPTESRYTLAAQTICDGVEEAKEWEVIAGYLRYDLSKPKTPFQKASRLDEKQSLLLLEILQVSVKRRVAEASEIAAEKKGKRTKATKEESKEVQEATAIHLAKTIPDLLKKFGQSPRTASAVLRLGHVLNLDVFQGLRQDSSAFAALLDDINEQFLKHTDQRVLSEASTALLHARGYEELEEATENKAQELWDETMSAFRTYMADEKWTSKLPQIRTAVRRAVNLAAVFDCTSALEIPTRSSVKAKKKGPAPKAVSDLELLMEILREPALDATAGEEADETLINTMRTLLFYYMWKVHSLQGQPANKAVNTKTISEQLETLSSALDFIIDRRAALSAVRLAAIENLLDLHTLLATFRRHPNTSLRALVRPLESTSEASILASFNRLEKAFAKKTRRKLESGPVVEEDLGSAPPEDLDDEDEVEDEVVGGLGKQGLVLLAERRLCEVTGKIVRAVIAGVLDASPPDTYPSRGKVATRISRNRTKLGSNFKETIAYLDALDDGAQTTRSKASGGQNHAAQPAPAPAASTAPAGSNRAGTKGAGTKPFKSQATIALEEDESEVDEDAMQVDEQAGELLDDQIDDPEDEAGANDADDIESDVLGD